MKKLDKFKSTIIIAMALTIVMCFGGKVTYADDIASGIYELENDVYHESEIGMTMSRSYLAPTMEVSVSKEGVFYTIGFIGSEYMENYRMKLNGEEIPVEIVEENAEEGSVKLRIEADKVDADMNAVIYVGPMERDVEFKVIAKMDTLNLIEAIEEEEEVEEVNEDVIDESENAAVTTTMEEEKSNVAIIIGGVVILAVVVVGASLVLKKKAK